MKPGPKCTVLLFSLFLLFLHAAFAIAQQEAPVPKLTSPEVHADGSVTFRFYDPNAQKVTLELEGAAPAPMTKDAQGVWSYTTEALRPDLYGYDFNADGVLLADPNNAALVKSNLLELSNMVLVPGTPPEPWEVQDILHGEVHHHFYKSAVVGDNRDYFVYTPPAFNPKKTYPVLYLLHGFSDSADGWTSVGKVNFILDALIAEGKAKPMIVVMPLGYGAPEILRYGWDIHDHQDTMQKNFDNYRKMLITELMPRVEGEYPISKKREDHAIAGLSMGGSETLLTGLNNLDKFAYLGAFSSGGLSEDFAKDFPNLDASANARIKVLYIACGTEDSLIKLNRKLKAWLKTKGVNFTDRETPGMHTWMVWRRNLVELAPQLFK